METILIIDDYKDILENLTEYFEMEGFKVLSANNGRKGIELAREYIPDIIICDCLMYDMDGPEVLRLLLASPETCEISFIFSTSLSQKLDSENAIKLGADNFIVKPYELDVLLKMVKSLIKSGSKRHHEAF